MQKLSGVLRSYDARMRVQAGDPAVVKLFQQAGFPAEAAPPSAPIAGYLSEGDGPPGLDVTLPDWLRDVSP